MAALRRERRLSVRNLSARLDEHGVKLLPSGILKIESNDRRVYVRELVALAIALDAVPNRILLPGAADDTPCALTSSVTVPVRDAWQWASGEVPRIWPPWGEDSTIETSELRRRSRQFVIENNPHRPAPPTLSDAGPYWNESVDVARRIADLAIKSGIEVAAWGPELLTFAQRFAQSDDYKRGDFDRWDDDEGDDDGER